MYLVYLILMSLMSCSRCHFVGKAASTNIFILLKIHVLLSASLCYKYCPKCNAFKFLNMHTSRYFPRCLTKLCRKCLTKDAYLHICYTLQDESERKARKSFRIYRGFYPNSDVDSLYVPRNEGGRGLTLIEYCVQLAIRRLEV